MSKMIKIYDTDSLRRASDGVWMKIDFRDIREIRSVLSKDDLIF